MEMELRPGTTLYDLWTDGIIGANWLVYGYENIEESNKVVWYGSVERVFDLASDKEVFSIDKQYKTILLK